jgi:large subunit ribosomal protein L22
MEAKAVAKYIRVAPRKARLVVDLIKGKTTDEAAIILRFTRRAASKSVLKTLNSAIANAQNKGARPGELVVSNAYVDEGPTLKRFRPRAMGRAARIRKRTSHITILVSETLVEKAETKAAAAKAKEVKEVKEIKEVKGKPKTKEKPKLREKLITRKKGELEEKKETKAVKKPATKKPVEKKTKSTAKKEDKSGSKG